MCDSWPTTDLFGDGCEEQKNQHEHEQELLHIQQHKQADQRVHLWRTALPIAFYASKLFHTDGFDLTVSDDLPWLGSCEYKILHVPLLINEISSHKRVKKVLSIRLIRDSNWPCDIPKLCEIFPFFSFFVNSVHPLFPFFQIPLLVLFLSTLPCLITPCKIESPL